MNIEPGDGRALGEWAHTLATALWPIPRSLTGNGVRQTLGVLARELPDLERHSVLTGYRAFDWEVPREWNLNRAWIETPTGSIICDTDQNNLHVVGYSLPTDQTLPLSDLKEHLHTEPDQTDAVPYVTSYYADAWGFCPPQNQLTELPDGDYRADLCR
jgi:aminopeptidase-like protein